LRALGVDRGDRILLMLGNVAPLWETMLAAMKLGAVVIPATTLLTPGDLADRFERGRARHVVAAAGQAGKFADFDLSLTRISVSATLSDWYSYDELLKASPDFIPEEIPMPTTRCCSTSLPGRQRGQNSSCTHIRRTRSVTCRRCMCWV
jgi:acetyl-CoA synthetase